MNRIALVTGAASGLGQATAIAFAASGIRVVVADLDAAKAASVAAQLPRAADLPVDAHRGIGIDVADEARVAAAFEQVEREVGPIAILAHFAGIFGQSADGARPQIVDESVSNFRRTIDVNLNGTFLCIRELLRYRRKVPVQHGRIITMSSLAAQSGGLNGGAAYAASKGAVFSLTKMAAREAAPMGITANSIAPGAIDTPMLRSVMARDRDAAYSQHVPLGRIGLPEDIAAAALYLASEAASYVTGSCIDVNGGMRMQ